MKKKISIKLTLCFLAVTFVIITLTSATYLLLLQNQTSNLLKKDMVQRARNLARGVSIMLENNTIEESSTLTNGTDSTKKASGSQPSQSMDGTQSQKNQNTESQSASPSAGSNTPASDGNTPPSLQNGSQSLPSNSAAQSNGNTIPSTGAPAQSGSSSSSSSGTGTDGNRRNPPPTGLSYMTSDNFWVVDVEGAVYPSARAQKDNEIPSDIDGLSSAQQNTQTESEIPTNTNELSATQQSIIQNTLSGKDTFTDKFSSIFNNSTYTAGVPVKSKDGKILGVLLYHNEVKAMNQSFTKSALLMLVCMLVGFGIAVAVSYVISLTITKPVKKMNETALLLAAGDYSAKTDIKGEDEISELGQTMDKLADQLDEARKESQQLEQLRRDLISNVSHELRTPLTVIRGCTESLLDGIYTQNEDILRQYDKILAESRTLERLVRDLLDLSKLQNPSFHIASEPIELMAALNDAVSSMNVVAKDKNVAIELDLQSNTVEFSGDYDRIKQMLVIILDNALKFTPSGGTVSVKQCISSKGLCEIEIADTGEGISEESLPHIFDRFYKSDVSHNSTGTGLGLAIAKEIANRMKIKIDVKSTLGVGTTFYFIFPNEKNS